MQVSVHLIPVFQRIQKNSQNTRGKWCQEAFVGLSLLYNSVAQYIFTTLYRIKK